MFEMLIKRPDNHQHQGIFPVKGNKRTDETLKGINIRAVFSSNLRRLRNEANLSQSNLAEKADLAPNFVHDIENGKKWISPESLGRLASALEVEPYQFFISAPKWNNKGIEFLSLFMSDIEKMSNKYLKRFFSENTEDELPG